MLFIALLCWHLLKDLKAQFAVITKSSRRVFRLHSHRTMLSVFSSPTFKKKMVFLYNFTVASSLAVACYMREWRWIRFVRSAIEEVTRIKFKYFSLSKAADKNGRKTPTSNKVFYIVFYQIFVTHLYSMRRKTRALQAIKAKKFVT